MESSLSCDNLPSSSALGPNPNYNTVVNTIPVGSAPQGVAFNPNNNSIYVINNNDNTVSVIDTNPNSSTSSSSWASACEKANESEQRAYSLLTLIIIVFAASIVIGTIVYFLLNRR